MAKKTYRLQKRVGSKARIIKPYTIKKTGFSDIGLYARFPWHQTYVDPFVGGWSVALNLPCFDQSLWNTRTISVIAVNDINSGIIDLAWCLLYIPYHFKMTVKSAIHCQGLWNECRDKALLDRFRSALRMYYSLEANFHKEEVEEGMRTHYESSIGMGVDHSKRQFCYGKNKMKRGTGKDKGDRYVKRLLSDDISKNIPIEDLEEGIRNYYDQELTYPGSKNSLFYQRKNHIDGKTRKQPGHLRTSHVKEGLAVEEGIRHSYCSELSYGGKDGKGIAIRQNMNRLSYQQMKGVPIEAIEEGLRNWYKTHTSWDLKGDKLIQYITSTRRPVNDPIPDTPMESLEKEYEEALRRWYQQTHSYSRMGTAFNYNINGNRGSLQQGEPIDPNMEEGLRNWYQQQLSFKAAGSHFTYGINAKGVAPHAKRGEKAINPSFEEGMQNWYRRAVSLGDGNKKGKNQEKLFYRRNSTRKIITYKKDYYDEIHSRLRWMQIFNEDFARFLKRFVGKMDNGFIYLDPPYFKTIDGKHYEDVLTLEQHTDLSDILHKADKEGTKFLLSYDVDERVEKLYSSFKLEKIQVPYSVARSYGDGRAQFDEEYLIMNYNPKTDPYMKKVDFTKKTKLDEFLS